MTHEIFAMAMKTMRRAPLLMIVAGLALAATATVGIALSSANARPVPPTGELGKFSPYYGKFGIVSDYSGTKYVGTLEIRPTLREWYVEFVYRVITGPGAEHEQKILVTWDRRAKMYRAWRFESLPVAVQTEGEVRFDGGNFAMEFEATNLDGSRSRIRNRYTKEGDEISMTTEAVSGTEKRTIGTTTGKRER